MLATPPMPETQARQLAKRGYYCTYLSAEPGHEQRDAIHETDTVIVPIEGEVELVFKGATHFPRPGREIHVPAWTAHTVRNIGDVTAVWLRGLEAVRAHTD